MIRFKLYLLILLFILLTKVSFANQANQDNQIEVTIYADNDYPPYSYGENGEPKGIYANIVRQALKRMTGYKVTIVPVPWKRGLQFLETGTGFALYPPYFHLDQRPYIWPYSMPMLEEKTVVFCRQEVLDKPRGKWPEDYYGLRIGNNLGFGHGGAEFWDAVKNDLIILDEATGNKTNLIRLVLGRIDCYINDEISILWTLKNLQAEGKISTKVPINIKRGTTVAVEQGFLGFSNQDQGKFPFKENFIKQFNTAIYDMHRNGEIQKIVDDYIK